MSAIYPVLRYRDADAAITWLCDVFGLTERSRTTNDGVVVHAELQLGTGIAMLGEHIPGGPVDPEELDPHRSPASIYCVVDDPDAHHARAVASGARIIFGLVDQSYGSREYGAWDLEGNRWWFGTYDPLAAGTD